MSNSKVIAYSKNSSQLESLIAFLKALKIKHEVSKANTYKDGDSRKEIISSIKEGFEDMRLYKEGNLETKDAHDLIDKL